MPVAPTERLVVTGFNRFVRNPMYVGLLTAILGQALLFDNLWLVLYAVIGWIATASFVHWYVEPTLVRTYGEQYEEPPQRARVDATPDGVDALVDLELRLHLKRWRVCGVAGRYSRCVPVVFGRRALGPGAFSLRILSPRFSPGGGLSGRSSSPVGTPSCGNSIAPNGFVVCTLPDGVVKTIVPSGCWTIFQPPGPP